MNESSTFWDFIVFNRFKLLEQTFEHSGLTLISLVLAVMIAVPIGIWISRKGQWAAPILGFASILQTVPSIALLGFMIPILGIGVQPAIVALFLYALLPILRNTYTGIREVDPVVTEAARGMGMSPGQILRKVELPLSLPVIFAGIRTAAVINVGVATLAAYIGAGGLGEFIFGGIALNNSHMILAGAIPAALLALLFDQFLSLLQKLRPRKVALISALLLLTGIALQGFRQSGNKQILAGFDPEFYGRKDGYPALVERYGISFNSTILNSGLMYQAVYSGQVDVISGYSTEGRIPAFDLKVLEDDQQVFPPYHCAAVIREDIAEQYPELVQALDTIAGKIDDQLMTRLNYQVDYKKSTPEQVAKGLLDSLNLYRPDQVQGGPTIRIGSKIFTEQYILVEVFKQLINGYTALDVESKTGLGGTKICFDALRTGEIDLYPEYTGTGLQVILQVPPARAQSLFSDPKGLYNFVDEKFRTDYRLRWLQPLGFNNTYALMTRKDLAREKGWNKLSDLAP